MHTIGTSFDRLDNGHFFNSGLVENKIQRFQETRCTQTLGEIITDCEPIALSLIRSKYTMIHEDEDELMSVVNRKLLAAIPSYDQARGTAFAFVSRLTVNMLATTVTNRKKLASRFSALDRTIMMTPDESGDNIGSMIALDDLAHQVRSIRSPAEVEHERDAQRWYVDSFLDAGFELKRHQCADAAMKVFSLSHRRSRQLYDLTLLEIRRVLWDETAHAAVSKKSLKGTKGLPLLRYTNFLTPAEFSKFAALMRDLAPYLVILVRPVNEPKIKGGDWPAIRENLKLILDGIPEATPLFE